MFSFECSIHKIKNECVGKIAGSLDKVAKLINKNIEHITSEPVKMLEVLKQMTEFVCASSESIEKIWKIRGRDLSEHFIDDVTRMSKMVVSNFFATEFKNFRQTRDFLSLIADYNNRLCRALNGCGIGDENSRIAISESAEKIKQCVDTVEKPSRSFFSTISELFANQARTLLTAIGFLALGLGLYFSWQYLPAIKLPGLCSAAPALIAAGLAAFTSFDTKNVKHGF